MKARILFTLLILATLLIAGEKRNQQTFKMTVTVVYNGVTLDQAARIEAAIKGLVADTAWVGIQLEDLATIGNLDIIKTWPYGSGTVILTPNSNDLYDFDSDTSHYFDVTPDTNKFYNNYLQLPGIIQN